MSSEVVTEADATAIAAPAGGRPAGRGAVRRALGDYRVVILSFVVSRVALLIVGLLTEIFIVPIATQGNTLRLSRHVALSLWGAWDSGWYLDLATHGYARSAAPGVQANWAFFPAYPALAAGLARLTHLTVFEAMLLVSNASFLVALALVHRLARAEFDRRTADIAVALLCVAPGSYIFSSGYTESLFLAAITAGLLLVRSRRWLAAGLAAALAVLTRNLGLGLLLPFAWAAGVRLWSLWRGPGGAKVSDAVREAARMAAGGLIPLAALGGFCLYLQARAGDPLAFMHAQKAWGRVIGDPFYVPLRGLRHSGAIPSGDLISFAACWLSFVMLGALALMRRWGLLWLALFLVLVPLSTGITSYARYSLVIVPLWLAAARLLALRPAAASPTIAALATLNGFMMVAWTLSLWVTA